MSRHSARRACEGRTATQSDVLAETLRGIQVGMSIQSGPVTAVWSRIIGEYVETLIEADGQWRLVIRERADGAFSHIVELDECDM